jgi:hypothetical protein
MIWGVMITEGNHQGPSSCPVGAQKYEEGTVISYGRFFVTYCFLFCIFGPIYKSHSFKDTNAGLARQQIREGRGIRHEDFWKKVEDSEG